MKANLRPFTKTVLAIALIVRVFGGQVGAFAQVYSAYGSPVNVTTASTGTGSPQTYDIGPGEPYPTIGSFNWRTLGPGDTVNMHGNGATPYYELLLLTVRGTAAAPITIQGVPDADGNMPILDGTNATQNSQFAYNYASYNGIGLITTFKASTASSTFRPGYLVIRGFELRNCYAGDEPINTTSETYTVPPVVNTWTDYEGKVQNYDRGSHGIYLLSGDNILIEDCDIHGNGEGVFGAGASGFYLYMGNIVLRRNYIWGNGNINSSREHNTYLEAIGATYEGNHYGPERAGALGSSLKDRSVGTIIKYNFIESSARTGDLVESENEIDASMVLPAYHYAFVYGNILAQDDPRCANGIHYGGDQGMTGFYRKGILYLWNNTIISTLTQAQQYKSMVVETSSAADTLDARNNIIDYAVPGGGAAPELDLLPAYGVGYWGTNWISAGWHPDFSGSPFTGVAAGTSNFIVGTNPGFAAYPGDLALIPTSQVLGKSEQLSGALANYPVNGEYVP